VVHGQVNFAQPDPHTLNITNSQNAIINWQQFSINQNEVTRFIQQSSASAVLNRVVGQDPSGLLGQLLSNGRVYLINPNGIIFGQNSIIDTAGFIASTLNMSNEDFLNGNLNFEGSPESGMIQNKGYIKAGKNGEIYLIAPNIENSGIIETDGGEIILAAGEKLTIASLDHEHIVFDVQAPEHEVVNLGQVITHGGAARMFAGTIKHSGEINANSIKLDEQGRVQLFAQSDIELTSGSIITTNGIQGGTIEINTEGVLRSTGMVEANGTGTQGGSIDIKAEWAGLGGTISADGETQGGSINVIADNLSLAEKISATSQQGQGGEINFDITDKSWETSTSVIDVSGVSGGNVTHIAGQQITSSGHYIAQGTADDGGQIDITAPATKLLSAQINADGATKGGQVRIGG